MKYDPTATIRFWLLETASSRWTGRPTELELYGRASKVADALLADGQGMALNDLSTARLAGVQRGLLVGPPARSPGTVNRIMSAFGTVLQHAKDAGQIVPKMPPKLREEGRDPRALTEVEYRKIMKALEDNVSVPATIEFLVQFLRTTGLRVSEALALTVLDFEDGWKHVNVVRAKSGKRSRLPLSWEAGAAAREAMKRSGQYVGEPPHRKHVVFDVLYDRFLRAWREAVTKALGRYGPEVGPHSLRRTFATEQHRKGTPIRVIQHFLGHRSVRTTERYIAVTEEDLQKAIA